MRACYQIAGLRRKQLEQQFPQYGISTIYKHVNMPINAINLYEKRRKNTGRVEKMTSRDKRILRTLLTLHKNVGHFTSRRIHLASVLEHVSNRTIRHHINKLGFNQLGSKKKDLLSVKDLKLRRKFCRKITRRRLGPEFWRHGISLYFDGTGLSIKKNPMDKATAPMEAGQRGTKNWLQSPREQGRCTASPLHSGHSKQQGRNSLRTVFWKIIRWHNDRYSTWAFSFHVWKECQSKSKVVSPNSVAAKRVHNEIGAFVFCIPHRSSDLNPIENVFHLINVEIQKDTIKRNITGGTFTSFSQRVKSLIQRIPKRTINCVIDIMDKRIKMVLRAKGNRIKYWIFILFILRDYSSFI